MRRSPGEHRPNLAGSKRGMWAKLDRAEIYLRSPRAGVARERAESPDARYCSMGVLGWLGVPKGCPQDQPL
jgi:hypothetical protein